MSWQLFPRLRFSIVLAAVLSGSTFILGFELSKHYSKITEINVKFVALAIPLSLSALKFIESTIDDEVKTEVDNKIDKELNKLTREKYADKRRIRMYEERFEIYHQELHELRDKLQEPLCGMPEEESEMIKTAFSSIENITLESQEKEQFYQDICDWMQFIENQEALSKWILDIPNKNNFSRKSKLYFKQDIEECVWWLYESYRHGEKCKFKEDIYASALLKGHFEDPQYYILALEKIKTHQTILSIMQDKNHLREDLEDKISYLKQQIITLAQAYLDISSLHPQTSASLPKNEHSRKNKAA